MKFWEYIAAIIIAGTIIGVGTWVCLTTNQNQRDITVMKEIR